MTLAVDHLHRRDVVIVPGNISVDEDGAGTVMNRIDATFRFNGNERMVENTHRFDLWLWSRKAPCLPGNHIVRAEQERADAIPGPADGDGQALNEAAHPTSLPSTLLQVSHVAPLVAPRYQQRYHPPICRGWRFECPGGSLEFYLLMTTCSS